MDRGFQQLMLRLDRVRQDRLQDATYGDHPHQPNIDQTLEDYYERIDEFGNRSRQAIASQNEILQKKNENFQSDLWNQAIGMLEEQSIKIHDSIEEQRALQQPKIEKLQRSYQTIEESVTRRQAMASQTIQAARDLLNHLDQQFHPERLWQSGMPGLQIQLAQSQSNLDCGFEETALAGAQGLCQHLIILQNQLETLVMQREAGLNSAKELASSVIEEISKNQIVQAMDFFGNPLSTQLEVDYWTNGRLQKLLCQVQEILQQTQQEPYILTLEEIDELLYQTHIIEEQISEVVYHARVEALSAQLRFNIAECALSALRSQGYELIYGAFSENDMRCSYLLGLENLGGSQVRVEVSPVADQPLTQNLDLQTNEREAITEHEVSQRLSELKQALQWFGLDIGVIAGPDHVFKESRIKPDSKSRLQPVSLLVN